MRGVPGERRQERCRSTKRAPRGRLAIEPCGCSSAWRSPPSSPPPGAAAHPAAAATADEGRHRRRARRLEHRRTTSTTRRKLASQARSYGATVIELYSPHATWARVKSAAQGANVLIYLGHGNGYPSPYGAFSAKYTRTAWASTRSDGSSSHTYYGEYYIDRRHPPRPERGRDPQPALLRVGQQRVGRGLPDAVDRDQRGSTTTARASCGRTPRPSSRRGSTAPRTSSTACSGPTAR